MSNARLLSRARRSGIPPTPFATVLDAQGRRLVWVAAQLGVDSSTVSRWRSGDRPIPEQRRTQLAALLGVPVAQLLGDGVADAEAPR